MEQQPKQKILIVEDDATMREALIQRFTREEFTVLSASDGEAGAVLALAEKPDIILLDIMMPKLDGMATMKKLRQTNEWGKRVPIILLTSLETDDKILRGVAQDEPAYYIIKDSMSLDDVVEKVRERLEASPG